MEKRTKKKEQDGQQESLEHQSLEVSMLNKDSFSDEELESYLSKGAIRASDEITVPPKILFVGDCTIATFGNFSASTGKAKSKKTFNISAMVAAAVTNSTVLNYRACLPEGSTIVLAYLKANVQSCTLIPNRANITAILSWSVFTGSLVCLSKRTTHASCSGACESTPQNYVLQS